MVAQRAAEEMKIVAVIPRDRAKALMRRGWKEDQRSNQYTITMFKVFDDPQHARTEAEALKCVYTVNPT